MSSESGLPLTVLANHFRPWRSPVLRVVFFASPQEGVGGKLTVKQDEIVFEPHSLNSQTDVTRWPVSSVERVEPAKGLGLIPNQVVLHMHGGNKERFVVAHRQRVLDALARTTGR